MPLFPIENGRTYRVAVHYTVSREIARGTYAEVYQAYDQRSGTDVALKVYARTDEDAWRRHAAETETLQRVNELNLPYFPALRKTTKTQINGKYHPLIVLELGEYTHPPVAGPSARPTRDVVTLQHILEQLSRTPDDDAFLDLWQSKTLSSFCVSLCDAVVHIHSLGIIHRDIKPANILLKRMAGSDHIYPFVLDFNALADASSEPAGTKQYLPPAARSGARTTPAIEDDLFAVSKVLWELLHGLSSPVSATAQHHLLADSVPRGVKTLLLQAIESPERSLTTAEKLRDDLEAAFLAASSPPAAHLAAAVPVLERDDFQRALRADERIRDSIIFTLETGDAPPIPKGLREVVALALEIGNDGHSTAVNLKTDLIAQGWKAFPAILEQSYKLPVGGPEWPLVKDALEDLARQQPRLAERAINYYCKSSSYLVRHMCMEACRALEYVPDGFLDLLVHDDGLLGPAERQRLVDLILDHAKDSQAFLTLSLYMCRAIIADRTRYQALRDTVALQLRRLRFDKRAISLLEDAQRRIWSEAHTYLRQSTHEQAESDRVATQLLGEAFASLEAEADSCLSEQYGELLRLEQANPWNRVVKREFIKKMLTRSPARQPLLESLATQHRDRDLTNIIADQQRQRQRQLPRETYQAMCRHFMSGEDRTPRTLDDLRFDRSGVVVQGISEALAHDASPDVCERALRLLAGFQSRQRASVVRCVIQHWGPLSRHNRTRACGIFTQAILNGRAKEDAIGFLDLVLREGDDPVVRRTLDQILGME